MKINDNLRELRISRRMTQEQVAEKLNVTRQTVSSFETGRTRPDIDTLVKLSEVYGTDLENLIYGADKELKSNRRIKIVAIMVFASLTLIALAGSLSYLVANAVFPLPEGGFTGEPSVVWEIHWSLIKVWQVLDSLAYSLSFVCFVVLLIMLIIGKGRIALKTKLIYSGVLSVSLIIIAVVCGLIDPKYSPQEYLLTPVFVTVRLVFFLLADIVIEKIRSKKHKA